MSPLDVVAFAVEQLAFRLSNEELRAKTEIWTQVLQVFAEVCHALDSDIAFMP
jgi:hypothetical protein